MKGRRRKYIHPRDVRGSGCRSRILRENCVIYEIFSMTELGQSENLLQRGVDIPSRSHCTQFMAMVAIALS